jgi:hypothetical protein
MKTGWFVALCLGGAATCAWADAAKEWEEIIALDAGPQGELGSRENAREVVGVHVAKQEQLLRQFIDRYPTDDRHWEAQLRLAHVWSLRADIEEREEFDKRADALFQTLEQQAGEDRGKLRRLAYARLTRQMRRNRDPAPAERESLRAVVQEYAAGYPEDERAGAALAEIAVLYDDQPRQKDQLLQQAERIARSPDLRSRIADDRKRVALLGKRLDYEWTESGKRRSLEEFRGKPLVICFFAVWSPPSMIALENVARESSAFNGKAAFLAVSLDRDRATAEAALAKAPAKWVLAHEADGWESAAIRRFGINALPVVWILDHEGRLRTLNADRDIRSQVQQAVSETR